MILDQPHTYQVSSYKEVKIFIHVSPTQDGTILVPVPGCLQLVLVHRRCKETQGLQLVFTTQG